MQENNAKGKIQDKSAPESSIPLDLRYSRREFLRSIGGLSLGIAGGLFIGTVPHASPALAAIEEYRNYKPDLMTYRRLGKTNLMVSTVSLGGAANYGLGQWADNDPAAYQKMLERLLDHGVNFFDTHSYDYSDPDQGYETEDDFAYLCDPSRRDNVFISTKVDKTSSAGSIKTSVEASLSRMGTDYIDLVYLHNGRGYGNIETCLDALDDLISEGKIRFKGMTAHSTSTFTGLLNNHGSRVDAIMGFYAPTTNWVWNSGTLAEWEAVYSLAKQKDVGVVAMKVLLSAGHTLADKETILRNDSAAWTRLTPYVIDGYTIPQACIRWALSNPNVHSAVLGMRTVAEAEEDVAGMGTGVAHTPPVPPKNVRIVEK